MCDDCQKKRTNPKARPFSLEYLALKTVLQKCIEEKTIDQHPILTSELCRNKWSRWCFFLPRNNLVFHVNEIISIVSEQNEDNRRQFFENEAILRTRCLFCNSVECVICRWRTTIVRYGVPSMRGHYTFCKEKY